MTSKGSLLAIFLVLLSWQASDAFAPNSNTIGIGSPLYRQYQHYSNVHSIYSTTQASDNISFGNDLYDGSNVAASSASHEPQVQQEQHRMRMGNQHRAHRILHKLLSPISYLYRCLFRAAAAFVASFLTAVIMDPALQRALGLTVKEGMNMWLTQSDVKVKLAAFQTTLSTSSPSLAKPLGQDFFRVFTNFLQGLFMPWVKGAFMRRQGSTGLDEPQGRVIVEGSTTRVVSTPSNDDVSN
jgi:hypothetical protein